MPAHKKRNISCGLFAALFCLLLSGAAIAASSPTQQVPNGGKNMSRAALAEKKQLERFGNARSPLEATDPDFAEMRDRLIWGEVAWHGSLDAKMQELITLVVLTASQTLDGFAPHVGAALQVGATPEEIKEAMYQCAPYIGFPKTEKALRLVNEVFREKRIPLPVASQKTVTEDDRFMQGVKVQKSIFGAAIDAMHKSTPQNQRHLLRDMLSAFCFGDVYTRKGLDLRTREILTFCIISSLGGCESQAGQRECGEHERKPDRRADVLPAVYRIPPDTERARVRQRGHPGKLAGARPLSPPGGVVSLPY